MAKLNAIAANAIAGGIVGGTIGALTAGEGRRFGGFVGGAMLGAGAGAAIGGIWKFADPRRVNGFTVINVPQPGGQVKRMLLSDAAALAKQNIGSAIKGYGQAIASNVHEALGQLFKP